MHFKMSSAICFNLEQSKIVLSGNGFKHGFKHHVSYVATTSAPTHKFLKVFILLLLYTVFCLRYKMLSHTTTAETMIRGERDMSPCAMTITNS